MKEEPERGGESIPGELKKQNRRSEWSDLLDAAEKCSKMKTQNFTDGNNCSEAADMFVRAVPVQRWRQKASCDGPRESWVVRKQRPHFQEAQLKEIKGNWRKGKKGLGQKTDREMLDIE